MSLGNFGVYKRIFEGVGSYKEFCVELEDGTLRRVGNVKVEQDKIILTIENDGDDKELEE